MLYENEAEDSPGHVGRCGIADESIEFLYPHYSFDHSARDHRRSPEPPGILAEIARPQKLRHAARRMDFLRRQISRD